MTVCPSLKSRFANIDRDEDVWVGYGNSDRLWVETNAIMGGDDEWCSVSRLV